MRDRTKENDQPLQAKVAGILGAGQLAYFLAEAAQKMGARVAILQGEGGSPVELLRDALAKGTKAEDFDQIATGCSWIAIENEGQAIKLGRSLQTDNQLKIRPSLLALETLADKGQQKRLLEKLAIPTPAFAMFQSETDEAAAWLSRQIERFPAGFVLKWTRGGYDGLGVKICHTAAQAASERDSLLAFIREASDKGGSVYAEEKVAFDMEMALVATRGEKGQMAFYPLVLSEQSQGVCCYVRGPASAWGWSEEFEIKAREMAVTIGEAMQIVGTYALEFFAKRDGELSVNEIAPRVHNSGHFSLSASPSSQFDNHWRAIAGLELGETRSKACFAMVNILGPASYRGPASAPVLSTDTAKIFWYEKGEMRPRRKMGHINLLGERAETLDAQISSIQADLDTWSAKLCSHKGQ